jgi:hypothetical protein
MAGSRTARRHAFGGPHGPALLTAALSAPLLAAPPALAAGLVLQGEHLRIAYNEAGNWNALDLGQGFAARDAASDPYVDLTWPGAPWQYLRIEYEYAGSPIARFSDSSVPSWTISPQSAAVTSSGDSLQVQHAFQAGGLHITKVETFDVAARVVQIRFVVENTGAYDAENLRIVHSVDPDVDQLSSGSFGTVNDAIDSDGDGVLDWAWSSGSSSPWSLGYGACEPEFQDAGHTDWDVDADAVFVDEGGAFEDHTLHIRHIEPFIPSGAIQVFQFLVAWGTDGGAAMLDWQDAVPPLCPECDADGDFYASTTCGGNDCDDSDPATFPGADEWCDGVDSDCDGDAVDFYDDEDGDGIADCVDPLISVDSDGDGFVDAEDCGPNNPSQFPGAPESCDFSDSDCDGDLVDEFPDSDGDGDPDCTDEDDDQDGTPDWLDCAPLDASLQTASTEIPGDGIDQDCNGVDATTCWLDADGDGWGVPVVAISLGGDCQVPGFATETGDCDDGPTGAVFYPGAPEACDGFDFDCDGSLLDEFPDLDEDGIPDCNDADDDGDGMSTADEGSSDPDGDGLPNSLDDDSDGDGLSDLDEGNGDFDGDGIPDFLDTDADGDGLPDALEGGQDTDGDGIPNAYDLDSDGDGLPDWYEAEAAGWPESDADPDGDGLPAWLDPDSDGDGVPDAVEGDGDADCDSIPDWLDPDDEDGPCADPDGDGIPSGEENLLGTNPYDADSDGDGLGDGEELAGGPGGAWCSDPTQADTDGDGLDDAEELDLGTDPCTADSDGDGLSDGEESGEGGTGTDPLRPDTDEDGLGDGQELDAGTDPLNPDTDGDGLPDGPDGLDDDEDGDGIPDALDPVDDRPPVDGWNEPPPADDGDGDDWEGEANAGGCGGCLTSVGGAGPGGSSGGYGSGGAAGPSGPLAALALSLLLRRRHQSPKSTPLTKVEAAMAIQTPATP